ncbi:MAG: CaiB/BaiF CoA transferase family protein [Sporichthyaceae bacterium]
MRAGRFGIVENDPRSGNSAAPVTGPLHGYTVIESASIVLGPTAGQYLADMGADVIKVESPDGDLTRQIGPQRGENMGALFLTCNRNKRSVVLDLKSPADLERFRALITGADVLLHSVRTPAAARLGIDYTSLHSINPRLVHCQVSGFGDGGPYAGKPAYDDVVQALSGLASLQSAVAGRPRYVPSIMADKITGIHAAYAIALGLLHRERTGAGQSIVVSMLETTTAFNLVEHLWGHVFAPPLAPMGYPPVRDGARQPFATLDGYLCVMPYSDSAWHRFFALAGRPEVTADPNIGTFAGRQRNIIAAWGKVGEIVATRTTAQWTALLEPEDIPYAAVNSLEDLLTDPHLSEVGFWATMLDQDGEQLLMPASPLLMSASPASLRLPPPRLGEHTAEVLAGLDLESAP